MQTSYRGYAIGQEVYAIARHYNNNNPTPYLAIFKAIVDSANFSSDGLEYGLRTPNTKEHWGDYVPASDVHHDRNALVRMIAEEWDKASDTHE